jgi:phospholipase/carboxylesterase
LGDSEQGWTFFQQALGLPWLEVVLVRAPTPYFGGFSWYDFEDPSKVAQDLASSRQALGELLDHLAIPPERLILGGFSQGAVMSLEMTLRAAIPWAGTLAVSGYLPLWKDYPAAFGAGLPRQRILATHGPWDPVLPYETSRRHMHHLKEHGAPVVFETFDKGHDLDMGEELPRVRAFLSEGVLPD